MDANANTAVDRVHAYVHDMLQELKDSTQKLVVKPAIANKHYLKSLENPEVLVPSDFLRDVFEIVTNIMLTSPKQKEISDAGKEFFENSSRG